MRTSRFDFLLLRYTVGPTKERSVHDHEVVRPTWLLANCTLKAVAVERLVRAHHTSSISNRLAAAGGLRGFLGLIDLYYRFYSNWYGVETTRSLRESWYEYRVYTIDYWGFRV